MSPTTHERVERTEGRLQRGPFFVVLGQTILTAALSVTLLVCAPLFSRADDFLDVSRQFADALLHYGTDHYGPEQTALWVQMIDLRTLEMPTQRSIEDWQKEMASWEEDRGYTQWDKFQSNIAFSTMSNLNFDGSSIRLMLSLSALTGDSRYKHGVDAYLDDFVKRCVSPANGLFAWGVHMAYDVAQDAPRMYWHEMNMWDLPPWRELYDRHSEETLNAIRAIYEWHIQDKRTYAYDRKAEFLNRKFTSETKPFWHHSPMYAEAFTHAFVRTGDPEYWRWAEELLTSIWSKRDPGTDRVAGLWAEDRALTGKIVRFDDYVWPIEYLQTAYELCGKSRLLEITDTYLDLKGVRTTVGSAREARVMLRASRLRYNPRFFDIAETYAKGIPDTTSDPIMASQVAHALLLFVELYELTGDEEWFERAKRHARETARLFVHESGLIAGTVNLKRPLYYDIAQCPGMLAWAYFRLGLVERGLRPLAVTLDKGFFPKSFPVRVSCRYDVNREVRLRLRAEGFPDGPAVTIDGEMGEGGQWSFEIPEEPLRDSHVIRFTIVPDGPSGQVALMWRYFRVGSDHEEPLFDWITIPDDVPARGVLPVSAKIEDESGIRSAAVRFLVDDRFGYSPVDMKPQGAEFTGNLRLPPDESPLYLSVAIQATDVSPAHNAAESAWKEVRVYKEDLLVLADSERGEMTGATVSAESAPATTTISLARYWWWPDQKGLLPDESTVPDYIELRGANTVEGEVTLSFPYMDEYAGRFLPGTFTVVRKDGHKWLPLPTKEDRDARRLSVRARQLDGIYSYRGEDRQAWLADDLAHDTTCPMFLDLTGDGVAEIVTGAGNHQVGAFSSTGECLWQLDLGTPIKSGGGGTFSHVAGCDLMGDGWPEFVIGSEDASVRCIDATGNLLWRFATRQQVRTGVAIAFPEDREKARLAFSDHAGFVYTLNAKGDLVWERFLAKRSFATPVFADLTGDSVPEMLCGTRDDDLWIMDLDGNTLWKKRFDGDVGSPAVGTFRVNDTSSTSLAVVAGTTGGTVWAFSPEGELLWKTPTPKPKAGGWNEPDVTMADLDGNGTREIVMASKNHSVHAFTAQGEELWSFGTGGKINGAVSLADMDGDADLDIVFASSDNVLYVLDERGRLLWKYARQGIDEITHCIVGDQDGDGALDVLLWTRQGLCLLRTKAPCQPHASAWATYRGNLRRTGVR